MEIAVYALIGFILYLFAWTLHAALNPIDGVWKRTDVDDELIEFTQFGPFVTGKRNVDGGNHLYSGTIAFSRISLRRRDFGLAHLNSAGFPNAIARKLNGTVMAKLYLRRRDDKHMNGDFVPQKILFDEPSARVMSRNYLSPVERHYVRTKLRRLPLQKALAYRAASLPPPPEKKKKKKGNTF